MALAWLSLLRQQAPLANVPAACYFILTMSNFAKILTAFTALPGRGRLTMSKQFRHQSEVGQLPRGLPGQRTPPWAAKDYRTAIHGLAGEQPLDAVEAARILAPLRCSTNILLNADEDYSGIPAIRRGTEFKDWTDQKIEGWAAKFRAGYVVQPETNPLNEPLQVILILNPPQAVVVRRRIDEHGNQIVGSYHAEHFVGPEYELITGTNMPPVSRQTHLTEQVFIMAGELLANTRARRPATPKSDPTSAKAGDEAGDGNARPKKDRTVRSANQDGPVPCKPTSVSASASAPLSRSASASPAHTTRLLSLNTTELMGLEEEGQPSLPGTCDHSGGRVRGEGRSFLTL